LRIILELGARKLNPGSEYFMRELFFRGIPRLTLSNDSWSNPRGAGSVSTRDLIPEHWQPHSHHCAAAPIPPYPHRIRVAPTAISDNPRIYSAIAGDLSEHLTRQPHSEGNLLGAIDAPACGPPPLQPPAYGYGDLEIKFTK